jgi:hypothetical protein
MDDKELPTKTDSLPIVADELALVAPGEVLERASVAAKALIDMVEKTKQSIKIGGSEHLYYEAWMTVGAFYDCSPKTGEAEPIEIDGVGGFKARAEIVNGKGIVVSGAEAYCMSDERNWKNKPLFQLASMAQTRAGSKALRNRFAWVAVLAGYNPTPAEEMKRENSQPTTPPPTPKPAPTPTARKPISNTGISDAMWIELFAKSRKKGIPDDILKDYVLKELGHESRKDVTPEEFVKLEDYIDSLHEPEQYTIPMK